MSKLAVPLHKEVSEVGYAYFHAIKARDSATDTSWLEYRIIVYPSNTDHREVIWTETWKDKIKATIAWNNLDALLEEELAL